MESQVGFLQRLLSDPPSVASSGLHDEVTTGANNGQGGRAAAQAALADPAQAARRYRAYLTNTYAPYHSTTAPAHGALLPRPRVVSAVGRVLTAPSLGSLLAPGWSIFWNDLLDGAQPTVPRAVAAGIGHAATARGRTREWFTTTLDPGFDREANSGAPSHEPVSDASGTERAS